MKKQELNSIAEIILKVFEWGMYDIPPGPKFVPLHLVGNIEKVGMPFYLAFLMYCFNNYSDAMLTYALLHGTYGVLWYAKHCVYPD